MSCHLEQGRRRNGLALVGVYARFPQYNARTARIFNLEDRINGCLIRSMNGRMLPDTARAMRDMVAWMAYASTGVTVGAELEGIGLPRRDALDGDTVAGAQIWSTTCAQCHGLDGEGTPIAPPTWGERSFNIGAGMARIRTAAAFIRHNMPQDRPGTLTD
ncbi:MAG TPA: c-type cytochrome, partial [Gemmatimonadales bacterium]|nr:c-type cytochrome [Gemmatimonadales bacterium]